MEKGYCFSRKESQGYCILEDGSIVYVKPIQFLENQIKPKSAGILANLESGLLQILHKYLH
ncbi:hypothetical protein A33Q_2610 [Indibacter alkaliphilus LW1]|uniref:Uncharacterized protein n=1 Tax=Indibacter alkaliphilus (strain CCUG 57479 / KCTC 22604 / LW1) TaxID=1189612 RepID=S2D9U9_INDAL|nr:hypothetical protein A33Q_2610 [Indibacter alkaliphilus LW1]